MNSLAALIIIASILCFATYILIKVQDNKKLANWKEKRRTGFNVGEDTTKPTSRKAWPLSIVAIVLLLISQFFVIVPTGFVGVVSHMQQIQEKEWSPGPHFKWPFVTAVENVDTRLQEVKLAEVAKGEDHSFWVECSDKTPVNISNVRMSYRINGSSAAWLKSNVGDVSVIVSETVLSSVVEDASRQLTSITVVNRSLIEPEVKRLLQAVVDEKYGKEVSKIWDESTEEWITTQTPRVEIVRIVIGTMEYEPSFIAAINAKNAATQLADEWATEDQRNKDRAEAERIAKKSATDANTYDIRQMADAQKYANEQLLITLNGYTLANKWLDVWNGQVSFVDGSGNNMIIDISAIIAEALTQQSNVPQPTSTPTPAAPVADIETSTD